jgi:L-asparaginase
MAAKKVVVLGTGGTIAGRASSGADNLNYRAGELSVEALLADLPGLEARLSGANVVGEQVAQVDSKDMDWPTWSRLLQACQRHLGDEGVSSLVITHGTDTLEETAFFLHLALALELQRKPVVFTCAMRPATALAPDGPQNLLDALSVSLDEQSCGVTVACAGSVHAAKFIHKAHPYRVDAFDSGEAGPIGWIEEGRVRWASPPLTGSVFLGDGSGAGCLAHQAPIVAATPVAPRVELLMNYAGAGRAVVDALCSQSATDSPLRGLVVAGTGNGSINASMMNALEQATQQGITVALATRCERGGVVRSSDVPADWRVYPGLSAVKARVQLMMELLVP